VGGAEEIEQAAASGLRICIPPRSAGDWDKRRT
jgi:hypothetical protein